MIGPFSSYAPPGVYTRTLLDPSTVGVPGGLRIPVFVGVSQETKVQNGFELRRGSSVDQDTQIINEDVSSQFDGTNRSFTVANFPIVDGSGQGRVTNNPRFILVTITSADESLVNSVNAPVQLVNGTTGEITLDVIPFADDIVRVTYFFRRTDTLIEDEDLSNQVDGLRTSFRVFNLPIVKGDDGGVPTTSPSDIGAVTITIGATESAGVVSAVDGDAGLLTIEYNNSGTLEPVPSGATLTVTYYTNTYRDTFDYLPNSGITEVLSTGFSPDTTDFDEFTDFIIEDNKINWGSGFTIAMGLATTGDAFFGDEQINVTLADNRVFNRPVASGSVNGSNKQFIIETIPVDGTGSGRVTNNPNLIAVRVGTGSDAEEAVINAIQSDPVSVAVLNGPQKLIELVSAPPAGAVVLASYYDSLLVDQSYTLTVTVDGPGADPVTPAVGTDGRYTLVSDQNGDIGYMRVVSSDEGLTIECPTGFGTDFVPQNQSISTNTRTQGDFQVVAGQSITEDITLTMRALVGANTASLSFDVTSSDSAGTGSEVSVNSHTGLSKNLGFVGQTYKDPVTGVRFTLLSGDVPTTDGSSVSYSPGDEIDFNITLSTEVGPDGRGIVCGPESHRGILGARLSVANTADIALEDTATVRMFHPSGDEPKIGDFYYISYEYSKEELPCGRVYTRIKDVVNEFGEVLPKNRLSLACYLAIINGASAVGVCQIPREVGTNGDIGDATVTDFIGSFLTLETPPNDPNFGTFAPDLIVPVTPWSEFRKSIFEALKKHVEQQSSIRFRQERVGIFGFQTGTTPGVAQTVAKNMKSPRLMAVYPDGAVLPLENELGEEVEYLVDGSFLAAAVTGIDVNVQFDVATPLTRKNVVGFRRLARRMDAVTMNQTAVGGVTLIEDLDPVMIIRHALSTDISTVLTREWSVTKIRDLVQQVTRANLDQFVGRKFVPSVLKDIELTTAATLRGLVEREIITAYTGIKAEQDTNDPTLCLLEAFYSPVFGVNWIKVTFNLRSRV